MTLHQERRSLDVLWMMVALALFVGLGHRALHHFDDFGYLYAATHYSPSAIAAGQFESSNVNGFFNAKIGHVMLLQLLKGWVGSGTGAITTLAWVYTAFVAVTNILLVQFIRLVWSDRRHAMLIGMASLVAPVTIYMAPKLLTETPAMLGSMASLVFLVLGLRAQRRVAAGAWWVMSALALSCGLISRGTVCVMVASAWFALWAACPPSLQRGRVFSATLAVALLTLGSVLFMDLFFAFHLMRGGTLIHAVMGIGGLRRDVMRRAVFAFGPILMLVPFAFASRRRRELWFYALWVMCSTLPIVILFRYAEERYFINGLSGMVGLAVLGGEAVWVWMQASRRAAVQRLLVVLAVVAVVASNQYIQPRTVYEVDTTAYAKVMAWIAETNPQRPIVIPWTWSDYHYLRLAYPDAPVYLGNTGSFFGPTTYTKNSREWIAAEHRWYGDRYVEDLSALQRLGSPPWLYVSWQVPGWGTDQFSWVQKESRVRLIPVFHEACYTVYRVEERSS